MTTKYECLSCWREFDADGREMLQSKESGKFVSCCEKCLDGMLAAADKSDLPWAQAIVEEAQKAAKRRQDHGVPLMP